MSTAEIPSPRRAADLLRLVRQPEVLAAVAVAAAWLALLMPAHPAMDHVHGMEPATPSMTSWLLMVVAMMGPAALSGVSHTARNSLRWRRGRAVLEYAGGYLAVWAATGVVVLTGVTAIPEAPGAAALAGVLGGAAVWQLTALKRWSLRECHRSVPLPPRGWQADRAALRFGARNGAACVGSCWCMMLAMAVAPTGHLLLTATLTVAVTAERLAQRPRRVVRLCSVALALGAVGVTVAATSVAGG